MAARAEGDTGEGRNEIWATLRAGTAVPTLGCIGETPNIWNPKPMFGSQLGTRSWHHLAPPTVDIWIKAEPPWGTFIYQKRRGGQSSMWDVWLLRSHCCSHVPTITTEDRISRYGTLSPRLKSHWHKRTSSTGHCALYYSWMLREKKKGLQKRKGSERVSQLPMLYEDLSSKTTCHVAFYPRGIASVLKEPILKNSLWGRSPRSPPFCTLKWRRKSWWTIHSFIRSEVESGFVVLPPIQSPLCFNGIISLERSSLILLKP